MLCFEPLERRYLLSVDVNGDGELTPQDALAVINYLNYPDEFSCQVSCDVNGDGAVTPIDALVVINDLNEQGLIPEPVEPAETTFTVLVEPGTLGTQNGPAEMLSGIRLGLDDYTRVADVDFGIVDSGPHDVLIETAVILVNGLNFRGQYGGGVIQLHTGYLAPGTHDCSVQPCNVGYVSSNIWRGGPEQIGKIVKHEFGHYLGWGHSSDTNCVMHGNASAATFCESEVERLVDRFGPSTVPGGRL